MNTRQYKEIPGIFEGPIVKTTVKIGMPIFFSSLLQLFYGIVDTFFISRIDSSSTALLSGTGLVFPMFFLVMALGAAVGIGISSLVGRAIGEKNTDTLSHIMPSGFAIVFIIIALALTVGYGFGATIVRMLAGSRLSAEAVGYGLTYFRTVLPGFSVMLLGQVFMGTLQGQGLTMVIAKGMMISTVCNIALDAVFIYLMGMGVAGAGLATSVSIMVSAVYIVSCFVRGKSSVPLSFALSRARLDLVKKIFAIGAPQFLSMSAMAASFIVMNKIVSSLGEGMMNSWTLAGRMNDIVLMPSFAISGATVPMISQNYGRGNLDRVRRIYHRNIVAGMVIVAGAAVFYMAVAPLLFGIMSSVPEVVAGSVRQVRLLALTFIGVAVTIISVSMFQATGKPVWALVLSIIRMGVVAIPLALLTVFVLHWGIDGVFFSFGASNIAAMFFALLFARFHLRRLTFKSIV